MRRALVGADDRQAYLDCLARADRAGAVRIATGLVARGCPAEEVLLDLVCPVQEQVGLHWECNRWNVAREHAATAISEAVVGGLAQVGEVPTDRGDVVVTCVENEWHALPARIVGEVLRLAGWRVTFLGASTPAAALARFLDDVGPDAVALSCSIPAALPMARRMIEASRQSGVPVIVGGRGFGDDDRRATRLGANGWGRTARAAVLRLRDAPSFTEPAPPLELPDDEHEELGLRRGDVVTDAMAAIVEHFPAVAAASAWARERTLEDLHHIVDYVVATLFVDDPRIFAEFVTWLHGILDSRGVPGRVLAGSLQVVADQLTARGFTRARRIVDDGIQLAGSLPQARPA